jgi:hypothetical protein
MNYLQPAGSYDVRRMKRRTRALDLGIFPVTFFGGLPRFILRALGPLRLPK